LAARHALLDRVDRGLIEKIALLDVDAVDAARGQEEPDGEQ